MKAKKVFKWIKVFLSIVAAALIAGAIFQGACRHFELKKIDAFRYGKTVDVGGKKMNVEVVGNGNQTIVLLPGLGDPSPILEFRQLAGFLSDEFTVVTIEPFGYGLSDGTDTERDVANIVQKIHSCLQTLGYSEYFLMPHSISGAYSVYYANAYPAEVKGIIGLDISVPGMYDSAPPFVVFMEDVSPYIGKMKTAFGIARLKAYGDQASYIPDVKGYEWSENEMQMAKWITLDKAYNRTSMDETKCTKGNLDKIKDMKFSGKMPVLFFLSENNEQMVPAWKELHENIIREKAHSKIISLSGGHYVYYNHGLEIADAVKAWVAGLGN